MNIRITVGDWAGDYSASTGREAIKKFFQDVLANRIKLVQLSPIGLWKEDGEGAEEIPFRIGPALLKAGKLSMDELVASFRNVDLEFSAAEISQLVTADSWMIEP